ncbi:helix-turn-helix domain-containing protein [Allokutzneria sp. A3M-2-11 16]|uniref:helix-turn-helix domain-containing protein n=1 Tax=Allokutzneria sp. A3M-2-11 16 TaxID=2962043 RepID=UPI0020B7ABE8|nr:helix-turn-helix domain-containing protein [Allokutzneria sp. A3M-2-11 16]MCP3803527.1 helix-turn-helix domain-containing protein [Allokutzneria sp. A3M-2-11 16]
MAEHPPRLYGQQRREIALELAARFLRSRSPIQELASEVNRRPAQVRQLLLEAGVRTSDATCLRETVDETAEAVASAYGRGRSMRELAHETGIDRRTLRLLLAQAGVEPVLAPAATYSVDVAPLADAYLAGETLRALSASSGLSYHVIRTILLDAGVPLRKRGGAQP